MMYILKLAAALLLLCIIQVAGDPEPTSVSPKSAPSIGRNHSRVGARDRMHKKSRNATKKDDDDDEDEDEDEDVEVAGWLAFSAEGISKRQAKVGTRNTLVQTFEVDQWDFTTFAVSEYEEEEEEDRRRAHRKGSKARKHKRTSKKSRRHSRAGKNHTKSKSAKIKLGGARRLWDEDEPAWRVDWALSLDEESADEVVAIVEGLAKRIRRNKEVDFIELLKQELTAAGAELPDDFELIGFGLTEDDDEEEEDEEDEDDEDEDEDEDDEDEDEEDEDEDEEAELGFDRPDVLCLNGNCFHKTRFFVLIAIAACFFAIIGLLVAGLKAKNAVDSLSGVTNAELTRLERDRDDLAVTAGTQVCNQPIPSSWKGTVWGTGQGAATASPGGHQTSKRSYRIYFGPAGKLTGSGQDDYGSTFTVTGTYEISTGKVAWREELESSLVTECVGYLRVSKSQGRGQPVEENAWVTVSEYNPQQPFNGEGWYSYEIAGTYKAFDGYRGLGDGALELVSEAHHAPVKS